MTYTPGLIAHDEHKTDPTAVHGGGLLIQGRQARAVLLQTVEQAPVLDDAKALGEHDADLLGNGMAQQTSVRAGRRLVAMEDDGVEWWRPKGRGGAHHVWRGEDVVDAVLGRGGLCVGVDEPGRSAS